MEHKINDIFDRFPTVQNIIIMMETKVIKYHNAIRIHLTLNSTRWNILLDMLFITTKHLIHNSNFPIKSIIFHSGSNLHN